MKRPYLANVLFAAILVTQAARAATPPVALPDGPLYGGGTNVHPNMLLNLSVTFPISGPAYHSNNGAYVRTTEYLGYFNTQKCYSYHGGNRNITDGYFEIASAADTNHECDGKSFSGNFMNWVSLSSVDILRYALTGGDRIEDKEDSTILQRAVLSSTDSNNANTPWYANPSYFPRRTITTSNSNSAVNKVTPFNASTINIVSCKNLILFSDSSSGTSCDTVVTQNGTVTTPSTSDKKYGEYLVRVKVCDDAEGPARSDLCLKYTSHYKPVGVIQRNADRMRFGVMSYLRDSSAARYGGVLRSPLKYVGPKKFDAPNFVQADNELREWDAKTGVFFANPDDASITTHK
jgi:type IV pilus assembly protein PilY1